MADLEHFGEVAVIGMAGRFPGAADVEAFWRNLRSGVESIRFFTEAELEASGIGPEIYKLSHYVPARGALEDIDLFDAAFFGISPREAEILDPQQRLFLESVAAVLENAGYDSRRYAGAIGIFAGCRISAYWRNVLSNPEAVATLGQHQVLLGNDKDYLVTRAAYKLNLSGPSVTVQTACSTSLVAVHLACQSLLNGECDLALAGASALTIPEKAGYLYEEQGISSPDGHCRSFDARARGTVSGSGVALVALRPMAAALADGDRILAVIKGSAINNDGASKVSYTAPSVQAQARVIAEALAAAQVDARTIGYVETHGTGTTLGDPIEIAALTKAFRASTEERGFCACGSVKSNIGHLDDAAGVSGLIKTIQALRYREIPPSLHFEQPNPQIDFANSPFFVNTRLSPWSAGPTPRRAGVSSLGLGGTNVHVVLQEAPERPASGPSRPCQLLLVSARSETALEMATRRLAEWLREHPELPLADVAYTGHVGRALFDHRRIVVCRDREDAASLLAQPSQRMLTAHEEHRERPVAFLFPGQGSQYVEMGRQLYIEEKVFREQVDRCAELLEPYLGKDLREVLYPSPEAREEAQRLIEQTAWTQPALFVVEYALARLFMAWGVIPRALLGHSIGEYVGACLAGVFSLEDALRLVASRGRLIQELAPGAMLTVPCSRAALAPRLGVELSLAAINAPELCVVSGSETAVEQLRRQLKSEGIECRRLHVSHAFHSAHIDPILDAFAEQVAAVPRHPPQIPLLSNLTGEWLSAQQAADPAYWRRHLRETVDFAAGMEKLVGDDELVLLEVGPGKGLGSLARLQPGRVNDQPILSSMRGATVAGNDVEILLQTLGRLILAGVAIDWRGFYQGERRQRVELPGYPFERRSFWLERRAQPAATPPASGKRADMGEWFYLPLWQQSPPRRPRRDLAAASDASPWLVLADDQGWAASLVRRLGERGQKVVRVSRGDGYRRIGADEHTLRPEHVQDYQHLLSTLASEDALPGRIVHAFSTAPGGDLSRQGFRAAQERGFYSLLALARMLGSGYASRRFELVALSSAAQTVAGEIALHPERATVLGPVKVIPQEYPNIVCRSIDLDLEAAGQGVDERLIEQLVAELEAPLEDLSVAYRSHQRWVQAYVPLRLERPGDEELRVRCGGVYLIIGGFGRLGGHLARWLARTAGVRLVLVSRVSIPERASWQGHLAEQGEQDPASRRIRLIEEFETAGAEVLALSADVADHEQMSAVLSTIEARFGALHGVFHAAGSARTETLDFISEIDPRACEEHFAAKVDGTLVLASVLAGRELDFVLLFSSLAAVLGGLGAVAYVASNVFLDAFAETQQRLGETAWQSIGWDAWRFDEPSATPRTSGASQRELGLSPEEGEDALHRLLGPVTAPRVVVSTGELAARLAQWLRLEALPQEEPSARPTHERPSLATPYEAPRSELEQALVGRWQELLGIAPIGIYDDFFELGGHSLIGLRLNSWLRETFAIDVPLRLLFEKTTVAELAELVEATILAELEELSEEEAGRLLADEAASLQSRDT